MPTLFYPPHAYIPSASGSPQAGALAYFYITATSTPKNTYSDYGLTTPNANPVVADANGVWGPIYLTSDVNYRVTIKTSAGATIYTQDDVSGPLSQADVASIYLPGNVLRYGAVPGVDCAAIVTTAAAANSEVIFPAGAWIITGTPTIPTGVIITCLPGATFTGSGAGQLGLSLGPSIVSEQISDYNPPVAGTLATVNVFRNPTYTGGPVGVSAGIRVQTNVGANVTNFEWAIIGIVNNRAGVGVGENVGIYGQGNKGSVGVRGGPTWGMVAEARDKSGLADATDGCVGIEIDIFATGTDANNRRIGADIVVGTHSGAAAAAYCGVRIGPVFNNPTLGSFNNGVLLEGIHVTGINLLNTAGSVVGIDISGSTLSGPALRLAQNQYISLKSDDTVRFQFDSVRWAFKNATQLVAGIDLDSGILNLGVGAAFGSADAIITQVNFPNASTINFSHRAQDIVRGTTRSGGVFANHTILTNITVAGYRAFEIATPTLQAGALVTNNDGFYCNDMTTGGTRNAASNWNVASGTGKWNLFAPGTAINHLTGALLIASQTDNGVDKLQVTGSAVATLGIKSTGATAGVGYATGAGGAVTQITSRTTGVTLNKICGAITLFSAAGSATAATFTVTNSAVAATDAVIVSQKSGTDLYELFVTAVTAGTFNITFFTTGGTTTEQPVFNFAIIKAVAA